MFKEKKVEYPNAAVLSKTMGDACHDCFLYAKSTDFEEKDVAVKDKFAQEVLDALTEDGKELLYRLCKGARWNKKKRD